MLRPRFQGQEPPRIQGAFRERSPFDLRPRRPRLVSTATVHVTVPSEVAATLRALPLLDRPSEWLVFQARHTDEGALLPCDEEQLEELLAHLAAEANHETDRRRQNDSSRLSRY